MSKTTLTGLAIGFLAVTGAGLFSFLNRSPQQTTRPHPNPMLEEKAEPEIVLANITKPFRCTIYYTPRETGFVADEGFDLTLETRPGLDGRTFGKDFLEAVEKEGFGRLATAVEGKGYIRYAAGKWGFAEIPLDGQNQPLVPKQSCAIKAGHKIIRQESKVKVSGRNAPLNFERLRWVVSDTGSGLEHGQLDLYWGEDDPLGPGRQLTRPKTGPATIEDATLAVLR